MNIPLPDTVRLTRCDTADLKQGSSPEWLVSNGIGGYAAGTVSGALTRRYHGLLVAALQPPLERTLLLSKLEEEVLYRDRLYPLSSNYWTGGAISPTGFHQIEQFWLEGTTPVWQFACADARLTKRIWMQQGENTTYVRYSLERADEPLTLDLMAFANYRDFHGNTINGEWQMQVQLAERRLTVTAYDGATPLYLSCDRGKLESHHIWYVGLDLPQERYRGLNSSDDILHVATIRVTLHAGQSITVVASALANASVNGDRALQERREYEQGLLQTWRQSVAISDIPAWIDQLVLAADQFVVSRSLSDSPLPHGGTGKTIIAGYPWFGDWGRDTAIALPGLTLSTGRPQIAATILRTFVRYVDRGMLPNLFPESGQQPHYNTVDAMLWYVEAVRQYLEATADEELLQDLFPVLEEAIAWYCRGTRYNIHLAEDGLIAAGEPGVQLTWMDAKVQDWVVTPRIGKPVEINALWYNALQAMVTFARRLGKSTSTYELLARRAAAGFQQYWRPELDCCADVLDGPDGDDLSLRPNQIFAVSLRGCSNLLTVRQRKAIVDTCERKLLTDFGLRSLSPLCPNYRGRYGGSPAERDGIYHQGTAWGWLLGPFVLAHWNVYRDGNRALWFLSAIQPHMKTHGLGTIAEMFDGDSPFTPRGCIAQAWSVAEILRAWRCVSEGIALSKNCDKTPLCKYGG